MVTSAGFEPVASWFAPLSDGAPYRMIGRSQALPARLTRLVTSEGFEPPTSWFEAKRSIQMSYEVRSGESGGMTFILKLLFFQLRYP